MLYMILGHEAPGGSSKRATTRPAHVERLKALQAEGRLVLAGPRPAIDAADPAAAGFLGSLIVAEFPDLASARAWADADPYITGGVFERVDVQPFVKTLP
jgi:uncharacterized protein YciI